MNRNCFRLQSATFMIVNRKNDILKRWWKQVASLKTLVSFESYSSFNHQNHNSNG